MHLSIIVGFFCQRLLRRRFMESPPFPQNTLHSQRTSRILKDKIPSIRRLLQGFEGSRQCLRLATAAPSYRLRKPRGRGGKCRQPAHLEQTP
ncbi:uncharacterized protein LOC142560962 isoform X2 [Dermacentor variabilis]|uniref:uncharacterized protein LOC142560962 isoform X2 n=1 Tax=Dermacentor variabilis TaxID=34621 RepID=UPI003F5B9B1F